MKKPELLAPAGNLEKLKIAFLYGADAVFVGGTVFGLRKYADNFSLEELKQGIAIANEHGKQVYLVLNGFAHNSDIDELRAHLDDLQILQPHGFIIADMGVFQLAKQHTTVPLHVSTQASVTNKYTCQLWKEAGAKRIILAREVSIAECKEIKEHLDIELEVFVHGAMCASYSGKCVISNYTSGRDSNRGGCVQSCRHIFELSETIGSPSYSTHIMNAKDLNAISLIPQLIESGIESLKIEGRMKSNLYVANAVSAYRHALDEAYDLAASTLSHVSNRGFSTGGLESRPEGSSINYDMGAYYKELEYVGTIKEASETTGLILELKTGFTDTDELVRLTPAQAGYQPFKATPTALDGSALSTIKQNSLVRLPYQEGCFKYDILAKKLFQSL